MEQTEKQNDFDPRLEMPNLVLRDNIWARWPKSFQCSWGKKPLAFGNTS